MSDTKAILFGLNYLETSYELPGCINDVNLMKNCLTKFLKVPKKNISIYHDNTTIKPSCENIINILKTNIKEVNNNPKIKTLWVHYSGHGSYLKDDNGDENQHNDTHVRGAVDEVLCPLSGPFIRDDTLNEIFSELNKEKKLICVFDCCHSGTALDLPYSYDYKKNKWSHESKSNKIKCDAILLSGAKDSQEAADAPGLSTQYTYSGAFTSALLKSCEQAFSISLDKILDIAYKFLKDKGFWQIPQITSTRKITTKTEFMTSPYRVYILNRIKIYEKYINLCDYYYKLYKRPIYEKYKNYYTNKRNQLIKPLI